MPTRIDTGTEESQGKVIYRKYWYLFFKNQGPNKTRFCIYRDVGDMVGLGSVQNTSQYGDRWIDPSMFDEAKKGRKSGNI